MKALYFDKPSVRLKIEEILRSPAGTEHESPVLDRMFQIAKWQHERDLENFKSMYEQSFTYLFDKIQSLERQLLKDTGSDRIKESTVKN